MNRTIRTILAIGFLLPLALGLPSGCSAPDTAPAPDTEPSCLTCAELSWGAEIGTPLMPEAACSGPEREAYEVLVTCVSDAPQCEPAGCRLVTNKDALLPIGQECWECLSHEGCLPELLACGQYVK